MNVSIHLQDPRSGKALNSHFKPPIRPWSPLNPNEMKQSIEEYERKYGKAYEPPAREYYGLKEYEKKESWRMHAQNAGAAWHTRLHKPQKPKPVSSSTLFAGQTIIAGSASAGSQSLSKNTTSTLLRDSVTSQDLSVPNQGSVPTEGPREMNGVFSSSQEGQGIQSRLSRDLLRKYRSGLHGSKLLENQNIPSDYDLMMMQRKMMTMNSQLPKPERNRLRATLRQTMIPANLLEDVHFTPVDESLLKPLPAAWKKDGSALMWKKKTIAQDLKDQCEEMSKSTKSDLSPPWMKDAGSKTKLTLDQQATKNSRAYQVRSMYRIQRLDPVSRMHGFLSDPMNASKALESDSALQKPSKALSMFAPTIRADHLTPENIEKSNPHMKLDDVLKNHKHNRRSIHLLWTRFKALCGLGADPTGVSFEVFRRGVPPLAAEDSLFVSRVYQLVDTDGSGAIDWEEFLATVSALEQDSLESQCKFFFQIYDLDGDGLITRKDLETMFARSAMLLSEDECSHKRAKGTLENSSRILSSTKRLSSVKEVRPRADEVKASSKEDNDYDYDNDGSSDSDDDGESESDTVDDDTGSLDLPLEDQRAASKESSNITSSSLSSSEQNPNNSRRKGRKKADEQYLAPTPLLLEACGELSSPSERLLKALEIACTIPKGLDTHTPVVSLFSEKSAIVGSPKAAEEPVSIDVNEGREPTEEEMKQANKTAKRAVRTFVEKVFQRFGKSAARGDGISLDEVIEFMKTLRTGEDVWTVFGRLMRPIPMQSSALSNSPFKGEPIM